MTSAFGSESPAIDIPMQRALVVSGVFHLSLLLFSILGLPHFLSPPPLPSPPISVEIVAIDKVTQTDKVARPVKPDKKEEEPPAKPQKPAPPPMESAASVPPEKIDSVPDLEAVKKPDESKLKPAPKKPPVKMPDDKKVKKQEQDFDALLKNLTPDAASQTEEDSSETSDKAASENAAIAPLSDRMTISEEDALIRQLAQCWNVPAGARNAENLVVEVQVNINPDRTVRDAAIVNQILYAGDTHFRAAADAALRALRHPVCTPLALPPEKYNQWKSTIIVFDPRQML